MTVTEALDIRIFGEADAKTVEQLGNCLALEEGSIGVLLPDNHLGYSQPVGAVVAYREHISVSGVGYDIGCGNKAVRTNITEEELAPHLGILMDAIAKQVSFGMGRAAGVPAEHEVLDRIREADFAPQRQLYDLAAKQLGTVGAGNHYVDLFAGEDGAVWVGVHFGSRGFGHKTASGFLSIAAGGAFDDRKGDGEVMSPPVAFRVDSETGQAYLAAMELAGAYAYAGRDVVVNQVLGILGAESTYEVHNHHNYAWREFRGGEFRWVVRKGATPAKMGERGFVGSTMGEDSVILEGTRVREPGQCKETQARALFSTVHGAGRAMSRTQAAGKVVRGWQCTDRECSFTVRGREYQAERERRELKQHETLQLCPDHPEARLKKIRGRNGGERQGGLVDWEGTRRNLHERGIELRGGAADEAPLAYKRLESVLEDCGDSITVLHVLRPIGVAMAGAGTVDPFKD